MADQLRPEIPEGYLGAQPKFGEFGLTVTSHKDGEFKTIDNQVEVKFKTTTPVKFTHMLIDTRTEQELNQFVFTQQKEGEASFNLSFPESDWYKLQIYALPLSEDSKSLLNVFNFLIHCKKALTPVFPFPKQYAQWKEGCYLYEPIVLHKDSRLTNVRWKVSIPNAKGVAVVADGEWHMLEQKGDAWEGKISLDQLRGKDAKVTLNANFGPDETKYATLLEYKV